MIQFMLPFGKSTISSEKEFDDLISRLNWQIEKRNSLFHLRSNTMNADTNKPLVGIVKEEEFIVTRVRPFYIIFIPQIFAKIIIDNQLRQRRILIKYKMSFWTSLVFIQIFVATLLILYNFIFSEVDFDGVLGIVIFLLAYPGLATLMAALEATKLKEIILELLES